MSCAKKVCRECPFRRASAPGYLGEASYDPHGFIAPHYHGDVRLPCHMAINWETGKNIDDAPICRGFAIFMKNNVKYADNPEVRKAMEEVKVDRESIFGWFNEFITHHTKKEKICRSKR